MTILAPYNRIADLTPALAASKSREATLKEALTEYERLTDRIIATNREDELAEARAVLDLTEHRCEALAVSPEEETK